MIGQLTSAQTQVLRDLADGYTVREIAEDRCITRRTVFWHLSNARRSLEAKTTSQAVALFVRYTVAEDAE